MTAGEVYKSWCTSDYIDTDTKKELEGIRDRPDEIEDRFYRNLEFGTGGLRGIIGAGTNRIDIHTIRTRSDYSADRKSVV